MGVIDSIMDSAATTFGLRNKPKSAAPPKQPQLPRVKTPVEYEEEGELKRQMQTAAALRKTPQTGQKLVPDHILNYGE